MHRLTLIAGVLGASMLLVSPYWGRCMVVTMAAHKSSRRAQPASTPPQAATAAAPSTTSSARAAPADPSTSRPSAFDAVPGVAGDRSASCLHWQRAQPAILWRERSGA